MRSRYEIEKEAVDEVDPFAGEVKLYITVLDYDYPYDLYFDITIRTSPGYADHDVDEFLRYIDNLRDVHIRDQTVNEEIRRLYKENGWDKE